MDKTDELLDGERQASSKTLVVTIIDEKEESRHGEFRFSGVGAAENQEMPGGKC